MADVYSNAHIVIAANRSDNCNKGCFHVRQDRPTVIIDLSGGLNAVHATTLFPTDQDVLWNLGGSWFRGEPLSTRGWALQERILARRIVHYNSRQLYFECDAGIIAEDGSYQQNRLSDLSELRHPQTNPHDNTGVPDTWFWLLYHFGDRKLTKPTDKLPAMSGLARLIQKRTNSEYVAGLWSDSLTDGIAWAAHGRGAPVSWHEYVGPSWSWASYDGTVARLAPPTQPAIYEVLEWHVELRHAEHPFGEVKGAWLKIQGPVVPLRPSLAKKDEHEAQSDHVDSTLPLKLRTPYSEDEKGPTLDLDFIDA